MITVTVPIHYHCPYKLERAHHDDSGHDLRAVFDEERHVIPRFGRRVIPCGLRLALPMGIEAQVRRRSGMAASDGVITDVGTIDASYRGIVSAVLFNLGGRDLIIKPGDRIAQLVFAPVLLPSHSGDVTVVLGDGLLHATELVYVDNPDLLPPPFFPDGRGNAGWGSTGRQ